MKETMRLPEMMYREFAIELAERADGKDLFPISFSSELPVLRQTWDGTYYEVLSHQAGDIDMSRAENGLAALKSHIRELHFGSITGIKLDETARKLRGMLGCSSIPLGQEQKTMVEEGHLHTVSVGYRVLEMWLIKKDEETGIPTMGCRWMPMEVSTEPVPGDHTVGFGRGQEEGGVHGDAANMVTVPIRALATTGGERSMSTEVKKTETPGTPEVVPEVRVVGEVTTRNYGAEAAEIADMCAANGVSDRAAEWMRAQLTPGQVATKILEQLRTDPVTPPAAEIVDVVEERDLGRYSFQRALRIQTEMREGVRANYDGLEAEVHTELLKNRRGEDHGGILVPWRLRERTLGTTEATGGATLVGTQVMPEMIDLLRNRALVLQAGARFYPGLTSVVHFNKKTGAPTVTWMGENPATGAPLSEPAYGYVQLSPKTLIGTVQIPRQLLVMSGLDQEIEVRNDLSAGHGLAIDLGALHGSGTDKQPVGIYSAADVQIKAFGGVPSLTTLTDAAALIADANADLGAMSLMTTSLMAGVLKRTPEVSGYPTWIWDGTFREGEVIGYPAAATNQLSKTLGAGSDEHGLIFGNWNDLIVGMWGNDLEIVVDPYKYADKGQIVITSYSMADSAVRRGQSFVKGTGAKLA